MRILFVFRSLAYWGGIERILVDKMNHLVTMYDDEIFMLTTDQGNHSVPYKLDSKVHLEDLGIRIHQQYRYRGFKRWIVTWKLFRTFEKNLSERLSVIRPDVIVCTTSNYWDINVIAQIKGQVPLIVESHSICQRTIGQGGIRNKFADYMYFRGLSHAQTIVSLTERDALEWRKIHSCVSVIPNMVYLNEGKVSSLDNKSVIWVGRLDYQKRPDEIITIWQIVHPYFPDWHLHIYGEGEYLQIIENMICTLNMNIHIHQPTERIFEAYRESSIFVSTSLFEPFGLVIPEAMSCGLPVVAYDCPYGPSSILSNGSNGFLVQNNNRQAFAEILCRLMDDKNLRHQIGDKAIEASKRFSAEKIMPLWHDLFENVASQESKEHTFLQIE